MPTTPSREAQMPTTSSSTPTMSTPCLLEVKQSSLNSVAGRVSIPTTRGLLGSSPTYTPAEQVTSISRPPTRLQGILRKHSFRGLKAKRILRKASGLQEHASIHSSQMRKRQGSLHHMMTGAIAPPSVKRSINPVSPRKRHWDELAPNGDMRHRLVCLRARNQLSAGTISKEEFVSLVLESATALELPEPFAAEYFVDVCLVGRSSPRVAGRGQLRRLRKHRDLLAAAAREHNNDSEIEASSTSDDDLSVGSDWDTDDGDGEGDDSSSECWAT